MTILGARKLARLLHTKPLQQITRRHPEWWAIGVAMSAWLMLVAMSVQAIGPTSVERHLHYGSEPRSIAATTMHWQLMVVAMMIPLTVPSLRFAAFRSLWPRRHRAIAMFLTGYLAIWLLVGVSIACLLAWEPRLTDVWKKGATAAAFVLVAAWQWTPMKRRALVKCHATVPLAPRGWRADRDAIRFGWMAGRSCFVNCGISMVACTLTGHHAVALVACAWMAFQERYSWRPNTKRLGMIAAALAIFFGPFSPGSISLR